ncbi:MAG: ribonuclease P protein component [Limisphaera sp.]|jgi:ribonuclease P protein component|nr:ribonuclease P protein component [Limisphaera sp.]
MSAEVSRRFRLGAAQRLRWSREFARIRTAGRRIVAGCLIVNWAPTEGPARGSRLGVVVGRKLGKATVRNRARRLLREVFRLHQWDLARPVDLVLVARPSIAGKGYREVEADFLRAMQQAGLLRPQERPTAHAQAERPGQLDGARAQANTPGSSSDPPEQPVA